MTTSKVLAICTFASVASAHIWYLVGAQENVAEQVSNILNA